MPGLLLRLVKSKDCRYLTVIVFLVAALVGSGRRVAELDRALAAKPKVEFKEIEKIRTVRVAGPVRIEEKIIERPGAERIVERVIVREAVRTETEKKDTEERLEVAACPPPARTPWRSLGASFDHRAETKVNGFQGSVTLLKHLDLQAGYRFAGPAVGPHTSLNVRF